jgi:RNA-directed DNA polymerase
LANLKREEPVAEAKPFDVPKRLVWEAYKRVKANRGAAGVDGQTLADFEKDLEDNLYKVWNRMTSGSYMPPPVRLVEIPKGNGGMRPPEFVPDRQNHARIDDATFIRDWGIIPAVEPSYMHDDVGSASAPRHRRPARRPNPLVLG